MICDGCWHKNNCADYGEKLIHCEYFEPMTEQEYLQTCSIEKLAEVLYRFYRDGRNDELQRYVSVNKKSFIEWLKQPHREE